jgi:hypothetical protein
MEGTTLGPVDGAADGTVDGDSLGLVNGTDDGFTKGKLSALGATDGTVRRKK